ncbi:hypothetical protein OMCYN_01337 [cyanobiont of Ornithocercus magnificus]|nr:hypothetical protein OMCYN_01337 [cyanobiont of Ornithocercus magnificus]
MPIVPVSVVVNQGSDPRLNPGSQNWKLIEPEHNLVKAYRL